MSAELSAPPWRVRLRPRRRSIGACSRAGLPLAVVLSAASHPGPGWAASGLVPLGTGAVQNGLAGAGTAAATDAFSSVRNPAAGARLDTQLALGLDIGLPDGRIQAGDPGTGIGIFAFSSHSQQSVSGVLPAPQFAYNRRLAPRAAWGLSLNIAGLATEASEGSATFAGSVPLISARCEGLLGGGRPLPGAALDIPSSLHGGIAPGPVAGHRLFLDMEHIRYEDSRPLSNPVDAQRLTEQCLLPRLAGLANPLAPDPDPSPACFGAAQGPGLGWRNLTVYKAGYEYTHGPLQLRLGYAQSRRPMSADQALPSMVAPATSRRHVAAGLSWAASTRWEVDLMLQRALPETLEGRNPLSQVQLQLRPVGIEAGTESSDQPLRSELDVWQSGLGLRRHFSHGSAR